MLVDLLSADPDHIDAEDQEGNTLLHYAYANEQADIVQTLEDRDADASLRNARGQTPSDACGDSAIKAICRQCQCQ